jgi:hypothetical protein
MEMSIAEPNVIPQVESYIYPVQKGIGAGARVGIRFAWLNWQYTAGEFETSSLTVEGSGVAGEIGSGNK